MKRALLLIVIVAVLIAGGFLSNLISTQGANAVPGVLIQTNNPEASTAAVTADKGAFFFLFSAIALGSVVGMGVTLAAIFWLLNRGVARVHQLPDEGFNFTLNPSQPNSIGGLLTRFPAITVALVVLVLIALSIGAAVAFGVFTPK